MIILLFGGAVRGCQINEQSGEKFTTDRVVCEKCGSDDVVLYLRRDYGRLLSFFLPLSTYHCRDCQHRFWKIRKIRPNRYNITALCIILLFFIIPAILNSPTKRVPKVTERSAPVTLTQAVDSKRNSTVSEKSPAIDPGQQPRSEKDHQRDHTDIIDAPTASSKTTKADAKVDNARLPDRPLTGENTRTAGEKPEAIPIPSSNRMLKGIDIEKMNDNLRITFIANRPINRYEHFFLTDPSRLVIDFYGKWEKPRFTLPELTSGSGGIRDIRLGRHFDKLRIVLDLAGPETPFPVLKESPKGLVVILKPPV